MKIQYIGDGQDSPMTANVFDIEFKLHGAYVEVHDVHACKKLSGNPCFRVLAGEEIEDAEFVEMEPKRRGRPPKVKDDNAHSIEAESGQQA